VPDWGQRAKDLTNGRGVDHVMEVGGPRHIDAISSLQDGRAQP